MKNITPSKVNAALICTLKEIAERDNTISINRIKLHILTTQGIDISTADIISEFDKADTIIYKHEAKK